MNSTPATQSRQPENGVVELSAAQVDAVGGAGILILTGVVALLTAGAMAAGEGYLNYKTKWHATR